MRRFPAFVFLITLAIGTTLAPAHTSQLQPPTRNRILPDTLGG